MAPDKKNERLREEFANYLTEILKEAGNNFDLLPTGRSVSNILSKFYLFNSQQNSHLVDSWLVTKNGSEFYICCIEIDSTLIIKGRYSSINETQTHKFLFGLLKTKVDYGHSFIREETIGDKIAELFNKTEIDFGNNELFSSKYYCLSKDYFTFKEAMTNDLMKYLSTIGSIELEFSNNYCLVKPVKSIISEKENLNLFEVSYKLSELLR